MARRKKVYVPKIELNITSMMDLVLNLLAFFVLTSNFAAAELPHLALPAPGHSIAKANLKPNRVIVSVLPDGSSGNAQQVKMGQIDVSPGNLPRLTELLVVEHNKSKDVTVDLRADKSLHYDQVAPVMKAITDAGISHVNLVADLPE